ncbi:hypothetical protein [Actinoplanes sp. NPDC048796]|uniref:hypothetical protein n=1 Tax=Actinoplanes sp. NPDC048796 TaxID=3155640 RepID=UPI003402C9F0
MVDDAQWLDQASARVLAFVTRRLQAESVVMLYALRPAVREFDGLPTRTVEGLGDLDSRALLDTVVRWPLDERVRDAILAEAHGNPLALLELPPARTPTRLAGGFGLPGALPLAGRLQESFAARSRGLSAGARTLLLIAAADPVGDPALMCAPPAASASPAPPPTRSARRGCSRSAPRSISGTRWHARPSTARHHGTTAARPTAPWPT